MFIHVRKVECLGDYRQRLTFADGTVEVVDLAGELDCEVFEPLLDLKTFMKVRLNADTGTVEWPNGADMAPEFLYEIGLPVEPCSAQKVA